MHVILVVAGGVCAASVIFILYSLFTVLHEADDKEGV